MEKIITKASKKRRRIIAIVAPILVVCVALVIVLTTVIVPNLKYNAAAELYHAGKYEEAIAAYEALNGYKDSAEQIERCKSAIMDEKYAVALELYHAGKYEEALAAYEALNGYKDSTEQIEKCKTTIIDEKYAAAAELYHAGKYEEAIAAYEALNGYKDSAEQITDCRYAAAEELYHAGKYEEAITAFKALNGYKDSAEQITDCRYAAAEELYHAGQYEDAITAFTALNGYKDSAEKIREIKYSVEWIKVCPVGKTIFFGSYEQDNNLLNGREDIEWTVLAKKDDRILVISRYALASQEYDHSLLPSVTWENCSLRIWLNGAFLNAAFSDSERNMIPALKVKADPNPGYNTNPGKSTTDQIFLLSIREANSYFSSDRARQCRGTAYCYAQGAYKADNGNCQWWLRSPGDSSDSAVIVSNAGFVNYDGMHVLNEAIAVRPALWIDFTCTTDTAEPTPEPTPVEIKTVHVSNVDEFLAAIAPNTEIVLASGHYNLSTAKDFGKPDETQSPFYTWQRGEYVDSSEDDIWYDLILKGLDNLHIIGEEGAVIWNQLMCWQTLTFENCSGLVLSDLALKDSEDSCAASGGILCLSNCSDIHIERCDVRGYGYIGLIAVSCDGLTVTDSDIHDSGGIQLFKCNDILIDNSVVRGCRTMYNLDLWSIGGYSYEIFDFTAILTAVSCTNTIVSDCDIYGNNADLCIRFQNPVDFSGTSVHDNLVFYGVMQAYHSTIDGCEFKRNVYGSGIPDATGDEATLISDDFPACDRDGNPLDNAALKAMVLKRNKASEQQPEATPEPTEITELPCSTPYWYEVFLDENGEYTLTDVVLFTCDFDGDGTVETLSCRDVGQAYTFLLDGEAFLTLEWVSYVTVIDLDPSTPYLNLIFAKNRTSEAYAESFEMHLVNGEFVKGATVAACLRWDGEALRGGSIKTDLLGTKDGSRIYAGENFEPQSEWFDCENIPTEEELENNRDELIRRGILLLVKKDLQGTVSGGQPTVIPQGTYVYMTRWHESNTNVKVVTEDGKAVYLSTAVFDHWTNSWDDYMRDFLAKNPDYDPATFYSWYLINGLPQEVYFDNLRYSD